MRPEDPISAVNRTQYTLHHSSRMMKRISQIPDNLPGTPLNISSK
jgi:hypothetical protein